MASWEDYRLISTVDQKASVESSRTYKDTMVLANSEDFGDVVIAAESITTVAPNKITPTTAASTDNVGHFIFLSGGVDNGTFHIVGVDSGDYVVEASNQTNPNFTGGAGTGEILYYPNLEDDLNYARTDRKLIKGTTNHHDPVPTYADPDNTANPIIANIEHLKTRHAGALLVKVGVTDVNGGPGYALTTGNEAVRVLTSTLYTNATRLTGLPTIDGSGTPDASNHKLTLVDIKDLDGVPLTRQDGAEIWGRLIDGGGTTAGGLNVLGGPSVGEGTDVVVQFFTGDKGTGGSPYTLTADEDGKVVQFRFWELKKRDSLSRDDTPENVGAGRTIHSGDAEQGDDIRDTQEFTGGGDNVTTPVTTNIANYYAFSSSNANGLSDPANTDLNEMANSLNNVGGPMLFTALAQQATGGNGDTLNWTEIIENLAIFTIQGGDTRIVRFRNTVALPAESVITIPGNISYKPNPDTENSGNAGQYLKVEIGPLNLHPDATDVLHDYEETAGGSEGVSGGQIKIHRFIRKDQLWTFTRFRANN